MLHRPSATIQLAAMSTSTLDREIRARIEGFVSTLSALVKAAAVESVQQALSGGSSPARQPARARGTTRAAVKRTAGARPAKRGKRSSEEVDSTAAVVLAYVRVHPGERLEEIGRGLKVGTKELKLPVAKLLSAKKLRTTGQKRGTKYFAGGGGGSGVGSGGGGKKVVRKTRKRSAKRAGKRAKKAAAETPPESARLPLADATQAA